MSERIIESENVKFTKNIFATLVLGNTEFALNIDDIQEVVVFPKIVQKMPLTPEYILGIFNLRGLIVPIVDLKKLLKFNSNLNEFESKVAIIDYNGAKIGLLFDKTSEVLRIGEEKFNPFNYSETTNNRVIKGVFKVDNDRMLQVIDKKALFEIENLPYVLDQQKKLNLEQSFSKQNSNRKKCIGFSVEDINLSIDILEIFEIVEVKNLKENTYNSDLILGIMHLRDLTIPIVDYEKILNPLSSNKNSDQANGRAIILKFENEFIGLKVTSVDNIQTYTDEMIKPVPVFSKEKSNIFKGCIGFEDKEYFLLNVNEIFSNNEILNITNGHSKLYTDSVSRLNKEKIKIIKLQYLSFKVQSLFAFKLTDVNEIINYPDQVFEAPNMPSFVIGMTNLRGQVISLIDFRKIYNLDVNNLENSNKKIIILKFDTDFIGLVVDNVESIIQVNSHEKLKLPDLIVKGTHEHYQSDIDEIIEIKKDGEKSKAMIILKKEFLQTRIQNCASENSKLVNVEDFQN